MSEARGSLRMGGKSKACVDCVAMVENQSTESPQVAFYHEKMRYHLEIAYIWRMSLEN